MRRSLTFCMRASIKTPSLFLASCLLLVGCASSIPLSVPSSDQNSAANNATDEVSRYLDHVARLDSISAKIMQSNAPLCDKIHRDPGVITHTLSDYPQAMRSRVTALSTPSVLYVRPDGAGRALKPGDILLGRNDKPVKAGSPDVQNYLAVGLLRVSRDGLEVLVPVKAPNVCAYKTQLKFSKNVNARAHGGTITVTTGLMSFVKTDAEIAFVIGHELAHNRLGHGLKAKHKGVGWGLAPTYALKLELEADYVGMYYLARAGYDTKNIGAFWQRLIKNKKLPLFGLLSPSGAKQRQRKIHMTAMEIEQKRLTNKPLEYFSIH